MTKHFFDRGGYLPPKKSAMWIVKILKFNNIDPREFTKEVWNVIMKKVPKKNTLMIIGPPNCGKTLIGESIVAGLRNVARPDPSATKSSSFTLQQCANAAVVYIDEFKCPENLAEQALLLCGGFPCPTDVKFKDQITIPRTPVVITTMSHPANGICGQKFDDFKNGLDKRSVTYRFRPMMELQGCNGMIHPYAWFHLLSAYVNTDDVEPDVDNFEINDDGGPVDGAVLPPEQGQVPVTPVADRPVPSGRRGPLRAVPPRRRALGPIEDDGSDDGDRGSRPWGPRRRRLDLSECDEEEGQAVSTMGDDLAGTSGDTTAQPTERGQADGPVQGEEVVGLPDQLEGVRLSYTPVNELPTPTYDDDAYGDGYSGGDSAVSSDEVLSDSSQHGSESEDWSDDDEDSSGETSDPAAIRRTCEHCVAYEHPGPCKPSYMRCTTCRFWVCACPDKRVN